MLSLPVSPGRWAESDRSQVQPCYLNNSRGSGFGARCKSIYDEFKKCSLLNFVSMAIRVSLQRLDPEVQRFEG